MSKPLIKELDDRIVYNHCLVEGLEALRRIQYLTPEEQLDLTEMVNDFNRVLNEKPVIKRDPLLEVIFPEPKDQEDTNEQRKAA